MSLDELSEQVKEGLEPIKKKGEDQFEELSDIANETTLLLDVWDGQTEEGVQLLHQIKDEHVR